MMRCSRKNPLWSWLAAVLTVVPQAMLIAGERSHVALVDPAATECTVCHKKVGETHEPEALAQSCLECHSFVRRDGGTYLVDEQSAKGAIEPSQSGARVVTSALAAESATAVEDQEQPEEGSTAALEMTARAAAPPRPALAPVAAAAMAAHDAPAPAAAGPARMAEPFAGLYAAGLEAFQRGDVETAFDAWESMLREATGQFTIQVAVDRLLESARHAMQAHPASSLYVVPRSGAYYVLAGVFPSRSAAAQGLARLPEELRRDGAFAVAARDLPADR